MTKQTISKLVIVVLALFLLNVQVFALVWANEAQQSYDSGGGDQAVTGIRLLNEELTIKECIIKGAGYFLASHSHAAAFLHKIETAELEGMDYPGLTKLLNEALEDINSAKKTYIILREKAENTAYNQEIIRELVNFNYTQFGQENELNPYILQQVADYLGKGDVRGLHKRMYADMEKISELSALVKISLDANECPSPTNIWKLGEAYSSSYSFGQYAAMVFCKIVSNGV